MKKIILASHGDFSKGLLNAVKMIVGGLYPGQSASDFALELEKTISEDKECEYIILSDLYGASVCTAMLRLTNLHNVRLFSGMNLNMVLELLTRFSDELTVEDIDQLVEESRRGIQSVTLQIKEEEEVF